MREIKFRAWNVKSKTWASSVNIYVNGWGEVIYLLGGEIEEHVPPKDIVLCQFTGLLDKHGKEIYEGYIVSLWYDREKSPMEVKWERMSFFLGKNPLYQYVGEELEIIGNIYENPDL